MRSNIWTPSVLVGVLILFAFATCGTTSPPPAGVRLVFGFVPSESMADLVERYEPLASYLTDMTGIGIDLFISRDYLGVVKAMNSGFVDLAYVGALPYVLAHLESGAIPIAGFVFGGRRFYRSVIITHEDSGITSLEDLRGSAFGFVDVGSTSGYLYPLALLLAEHINPERDFDSITFTGGHDSLVQAILDRDLDAGATRESSFSGAGMSSVVVLATSEPIVNPCIAVSPSVDPELVAAIAAALHAMHNDPDGLEVLSRLGADRFVPVLDSEYDPVRDVVRILDLDLYDQ